MYANLIGYSDVTPFEIIRTFTPKKMEVRKMSAERAEPAQPLHWELGGFAGCCTNQFAQRWTITPDASEYTVIIRQHKDGQWRDTAGQRYALADEPIRFYDLNF